jgi:hypothetical protein
VYPSELLVRILEEPQRKLRTLKFAEILAALRSVHAAGLGGDC